MKSIDELVYFSNKYGKDPEFVLAGGGNTSFKDNKTLWIKGSGTSLSTIDESGFVRMDRSRLNKIWNADFSEETAKREAEVLSALMNSKEENQEGKRPSVETLFHDLFSQSFVLHVHPAAVNGVLCSKNGEITIKDLFPESIWLDACEPGYIMASAFRRSMTDYKNKTGKDAFLVFHQNHGVFFAADSVDELEKLVSSVMDKIKGKIKSVPDFSEPENVDYDKASKLSVILRMIYDRNGASRVRFTASKTALEFAESKESFEKIRLPLTPDHIVYCRPEPIYLETADADDVKARVEIYKNKFGFLPKVAFAKGLGVFCIGSNEKEVSSACALIKDAMTVVTYSDSFGGVLPLSEKLTDFIVNWEVENYRSKISTGVEGGKPLASKIAIVTGSAQGFGEGIARFLASKGASVVIADINEEGAAKTAKSISDETGSAAIPVKVNIADEQSVIGMIRDTVLHFGGLDIFVNNAGIVRAGSLDEMTKQNFDLVTSINYTAYFMCAKYASSVMKSQRAVSPDYMADIIEINSKSGLTGSNKNFAYAGSKFGGLGLTQSFALELAPFGIKVNAVCPGNFLDGPLWSDPDRGLFVQYLNAGKVPGAKTVADVKKFYESKVPLGRGCTPEDVNRAVLYIIEQKYETGQAVPVTGGQEMLN